MYSSEPSINCSAIIGGKRACFFRIIREVPENFDASLVLLLSNANFHSLGSVIIVIDCLFRHRRVEMIDACSSSSPLSFISEECEKVELQKSIEHDLIKRDLQSFHPRLLLRSCSLRKWRDLG